MPRSWTTEEHYKFLYERKSEFLELKKTTRKYETFFSEVCSAFFNKFTDMDDNKFNREKLIRWYRWHCTDEKKSRGRNVSSMKFTTPTRTRDLRDIEVYQHMFYDNKLKPIVRHEIDAAGHSSIDLINGVIAREFKNESHEVKKMVEERKKELNKERRALKVLEPDLAGEARQQAIKDMPNTIHEVLERYRAATGHHAFILFGGPVPELDEEVRVNFLQTAPFSYSHPSFNDDVLQPFMDYMNSLYGSSDSSVEPSGNSVTSSIGDISIKTDTSSQTVNDDGGCSSQDVVMVVGSESISKTLAQAVIPSPQLANDDPRDMRVDLEPTTSEPPSTTSRYFDSTDHTLETSQDETHAMTFDEDLGSDSQSNEVSEMMDIPNSTRPEPQAPQILVSDSIIGRLAVENVSSEMEVETEMGVETEVERSDPAPAATPLRADLVNLQQPTLRRSVRSSTQTMRARNSWNQPRRKKGNKENIPPAA